MGKVRRTSEATDTEPVTVKDREGACPVCGKEIGEYQAFVMLEDVYGFYPFVCDACNCVGKEWFRLVYRDTEFEKRTPLRKAD